MHDYVILYVLLLLLGFFVLTSIYVHSDLVPGVLALCFVLGYTSLYLCVGPCERPEVLL